MPNRYWVGGTGFWDTSTTTNWSATSGGASGASAPTYLDDVFINSASAAAPFTITIANNAICQNLTVTSPGTGKDLTFAGTDANTILIYGDMTLPTTNLTPTTTGGVYWYFRSNNGLTRTITTNGFSPSLIAFDGQDRTNSSFRLGSNFTAGGAEFRLIGGTLNTASFNVYTASQYSPFFMIMGSNTKTLTMGNSAFDVGVWKFTNEAIANTIVNSNTSKIRIYGTWYTNEDNEKFYGGGKTWYDVERINSGYTGSSLKIVGANNSFNNVALYPAPGWYSGYGNLIFAGGPDSNTIIRGTLIANTSQFSPLSYLQGGENTTYTIPASYLSQIGSNSVFVPATLTVNNIDLQDVILKNINLKGNAAARNPFQQGTSVRIGDGGGNSGINFNRRNVYWIKTSGSGFFGNNFSLTSGGSIDYRAWPNPGCDTVIIDNNSGTINIAHPVILNQPHEFYGTALLYSGTINTRPRTAETYIRLGDASGYNGYYGNQFRYDNVYFGNSTTLLSNTYTQPIRFFDSKDNEFVITDNVALPSIYCYKTSSEGAVDPTHPYNQRPWKSNVYFSMARGNTINIRGQLLIRGGFINVSDPSITTVNIDNALIIQQGWEYDVNYKGLDATGKRVNITGNSAPGTYKDVWNSQYQYHYFNSQQGEWTKFNRPGGQPLTIYLTGNTINTAVGGTFLPSTGERRVGVVSSPGIEYSSLPGGGGTNITPNLINVIVEGGTDNVRLTHPYNNIDTSGFGGRLILEPVTIYGNLITNTATTITTPQLVNFRGYTGTSNKILDLKGSQIDHDIAFQDALGNTWTLLSKLNTNPTRILYHYTGTLDLSNSGGQTLTCGTYTPGTAAAKSIVFNGGTLEITGATFTGSSTLSLSNWQSGNIRMSSASAKTFAGGGFNYPTLEQAGQGTLTITGANLFNDIKSNTAGGGSAIVLPSSTVTRVNNFTLIGGTIRRSNLRSSTAGTIATLNGIGPSQLYSASMLDIKDISAGNGTWSATFSTNTNNLGITFQPGNLAARLSNTAFYATLLDETTTNVAESLYTTPGTYTWVAPAGVTSVNAVCVGAGASGSVLGNGAANTGGGGGGGGLGWKNNIAVTPGQSYTVVVGAGGAARSSSSTPLNGIDGGNSYFINTSTVFGGGGKGGVVLSAAGGGGAGGTYVGDGGGNGGAGGGDQTTANEPKGGGGGGAGGYSGPGGTGGFGKGDQSIFINEEIPGTQPTAGQGGGGGGGAAAYGTFNGVGNSNSGGAGGGGVGLYGEGAGGTAVRNVYYRRTAVNEGGDGSGAPGGIGGSYYGLPGTRATYGFSYPNFGGAGGFPGGGGGGSAGYGQGGFQVNYSGAGADGAVRIFWSTPNANTVRTYSYSTVGLLDETITLPSNTPMKQFANSRIQAKTFDEES